MMKTTEQYQLSFHINAFNYSKCPVITDAEPSLINMFNWGLIPTWVKGEEKANELKINTLNAKCETIFEKPSFRSAIIKKRCLIPATGMANRISEEFLNDVDKHKYVIYLSAETGDLESAKSIAEAGKAILKSGGIGIKVETTGKAFTKEHWIELLNDFEESNLYQMFVLDCISDGKRKTYSCGMHNIGLRDGIVYNEEFQESVNLLSIFGYYQLIDKPEIKNNQTFSISAEAPIFVISEEMTQPNKGDELFENPYGMWKLERKVSK